MSEFPDVAEKALPFACKQTTVLFSSPFFSTSLKSFVSVYLFFEK